MRQLFVRSAVMTALLAGFTFGGTLFTAASSCSGALHPTAASNPVESQLSWIAK